MLDAIASRTTKTLPPDVRAAIAAWKPDPKCIAAGDEYLSLAFRAWACSLTDAQIARRVNELTGLSTPAFDRFDAAAAVARHGAFVDLPTRKIIAILACLAAEVPCWPDADEIAEIALAAVAERAL